MDKCREEFEAQFKINHPLHWKFFLVKDGSGDYSHYLALDAWEFWQAAWNTRPSSRGEAGAYLHHIVDSTDGEEDLALSFSPDSFPFDSLEQYTSIKVEPLYTAPGVVAGEVDG